jgi:hypothetical protein
MAVIRDYEMCSTTGPFAAFNEIREASSIIIAFANVDTAIPEHSVA